MVKSLLARLEPNTTEGHRDGGQVCLSLLVPFSTPLLGHSGLQRFEPGALWGCLLSETLRQAEGKPEDPLQALALPARGNPLFLGWEDTEAEGGYQLYVQATGGLACRHPGTDCFWMGTSVTAAGGS